MISACPAKKGILTSIYAISSASPALLVLVIYAGSCAHKDLLLMDPFVKSHKLMEKEQDLRSIAKIVRSGACCGIRSAERAITALGAVFARQIVSTVCMIMDISAAEETTQELMEKQ